MRRFLEFAGAVVFGAVLLTHQLLAPARGITYTGRHRVARGYLTTMQEAAVSADAQHAGLVALDVLRRESAELPQRVPGATFATQPLPEDGPDPTVVRQIRARLRGIAFADVDDDMYAAVP